MRRMSGSISGGQSASWAASATHRFPKGILLSGHCTDAGAAQCLCGREQSSVYLGSQRICHTYAGRRGDVSGGKVFPVLSFAGGHVPFLYDADLNAVGDSSYTETLEANIRVIGQFLDKLKQSDLYDNSVIIVMADHGFDPQNEVSAYDRQNPLFLVKVWERAIRYRHRLFLQLTRIFRMHM